MLCIWTLIVYQFLLDLVRFWSLQYSALRSQFKWLTVIWNIGLTVSFKFTINEEEIWLVVRYMLVWWSSYTFNFTQLSSKRNSQYCVHLLRKKKLSLAVIHVFILTSSKFGRLIDIVNLYRLVHVLWVLDLDSRPHPDTGEPALLNSFFICPQFILKSDIVRHGNWTRIRGFPLKKMSAPKNKMARSN